MKSQPLLAGRWWRIIIGLTIMFALFAAAYTTAALVSLLAGGMSV